MKKIAIILFAVLVGLSSAMAKKEAPGAQPKSFAQKLEEIKWKPMSSIGVESADKLFESSNLFYKSIESMHTNLPIYSLKAIVENGDTTAIVVVDQFNKPFASGSAVMQIVQGGAHLTAVTASGVSLVSNYAGLIKDLPSLLKDNPLLAITAGKKVADCSKKIGKLTKEFLPELKDMYEKRGNPIKEYSKAQAALTKDDGFITTGFGGVPEFDPADLPSDEELEMLLEQERSARN